MAALHAALQSLAPTPFAAVPTSPALITSYLENASRDAQIIIDSVPLPAPADLSSSGTLAPTTRPRSSTSASVASAISDISSSSARSDPFNTSNVSLQKEWGKPIKLAAKENPLQMSVYKLGGKDGRGAWFARRSVHEGLPFDRWKLGLQREFPETLEVQGGPGEGNIRGIGGERRVEHKAIGGVGTLEVYHLSAQFPGPTTPRDFVTLLVTSSNAGDQSGSGQVQKRSAQHPRHFMVVSRPCEHPDCPPREGFVRGQYESVEFIREIPRKPKKSASAVDLGRFDPGKSADGEKDATTVNGGLEPTGKTEGRARGKTISFAGLRSSDGGGGEPVGVDDEEEMNPVEWVMITRSDPGGSVPRFMVERGTPGSIVADASKFLDWACKKEHAPEDIAALETGDTSPAKSSGQEEHLAAHQTNGHLAGIASGVSDQAQTTNGLGHAPANGAKVVETGERPEATGQQQSESMFASFTSAAMSGLESYAPQVVIDHLPGHQVSGTKNAEMLNSSSSIGRDADSIISSSSASSVMSFASAEDHFEGVTNKKSIPAIDGAADSAAKSISSSVRNEETTYQRLLGLQGRIEVLRSAFSKLLDSAKNSSLPATAKDQERVATKLQARLQSLDTKSAKTLEQHQPRNLSTESAQIISTKDQDRVRKTTDKYLREMTKIEEKFKREAGRLENKAVKEEEREKAKKAKVEEKDERTRFTKELDEMKAQLLVVTKERDELKARNVILEREKEALSLNKEEL